MKMEALGENPVAPASPPQSTSLVADLLKFGTAAVQLISQQQLAKTNIQRAAQGLPPIQVGDVPGLTPTVQVQGGLDPATRNMLMIGGLGLAALLIVPKLLRKRR